MTDVGTVLETERLRLRRFTAADLDDLAALNGDPAVMRFIATPQPRAVVERDTLPAILRQYRELPAAFGWWAAVARDSDEFLGCLSMVPGTGAEARIGWRLRPAVWGRGYATEGARALVRRAFTQTPANRVAAGAMTVNRASQRVMEKAGLRLQYIYYAQWDDPLPGTEHGDVEYALGRVTWARECGTAGLGGH
jgi:RimJ/RimL family protein N-acetyltransferase